MENFIIAAILILIVGAIVDYLIRSKKRGKICIGCPYGKKCEGKCSEKCSNKETEKHEN